MFPGSYILKEELDFKYADMLCISGTGKLTRKEKHKCIMKCGY
jgi:hypothetical protein